MIKKINTSEFSKSILLWYKKNKRDLPWRSTKDPYKIWVSEIILQQTQINQGINYYINFINNFPDLESLAKSNKKKVLKNWEGLGYYSRATNMLDNAKKIINEQKQFPKDYKELIKLKGIGEYTAAAISSICFDEKKGVVDGNVFRVLSRIFNIETPINTTMGKKEFSELANKLIPKKNVGDYNQGLMDFGSILCKKNFPKCEICIFKQSCLALKFNTIRERPVKKISNSKKKHRILNYFLITDSFEHLYIQKITNKIWKNLYQLPLFESKKIINKKYILKENLMSNFFSKIELTNVVMSKQVLHNLSHQKLNIFFWKITVNGTLITKKDVLQKISKKEINSYPFPSPIKIYLHELLS